MAVFLFFFVCLFITRKWWGDCIQIFRIAPGHPLNSLRCKKVGVDVFGRGPETWHFLYFTALAGQAPGEWDPPGLPLLLGRFIVLSLLGHS